MNTVIITLSEDDARLFVEFQKNYNLFKLLDSVKAFDIRDGSIRIHFNHLGQIGVIDKFESFRI